MIKRAEIGAERENHQAKAPIAVSNFFFALVPRSNAARHSRK